MRAGPSLAPVLPAWLLRGNWRSIFRTMRWCWWTPRKWVSARREEMPFCNRPAHDIGAEDYIGDIETAKISLNLNLTGQRILKSLVDAHQIDCQFRASGKYQAAVEDRGVAVLEAYRRGLDKLGQAYEMIDGKDLPHHIGTSFYRQALSRREPP